MVFLIIIIAKLKKNDESWRPEATKSRASNPIHSPPHQLYNFTTITLQLQKSRYTTQDPLNVHLQVIAITSTRVSTLLRLV